MMEISYSDAKMDKLTEAVIKLTVHAENSDKNHSELLASMREWSKEMKEIAKAMMSFDSFRGDVKEDVTSLSLQVSNLRHHVNDTNMGPAVEMLQVKMSSMSADLRELQVKTAIHGEYITEHKSESAHGMKDLTTVIADVKALSERVLCIEGENRVEKTHKTAVLNTAKSVWGPTKWMLGGLCTLAVGAVTIIGWLTVKYIEMKFGVTL